MKKIVAFIFVLVVVISVIAWVYLFAKYANKPIGEMPTWVYYLLFDNGK